MHVMRFRTAGGHEFVTYEQRERQVRQPAAVQMPELAAPASKLGAAEPMPARGHARPRRYFADDAVVDGVGHWLPHSLASIEVPGSRFQSSRFWFEP
jgi:hypothetical protein